MKKRQEQWLMITAGTIEVKLWIDAEAIENPDDPRNQKPKPEEQGYARVWGRLKAFNNKRHVGANIIRPVQDYNEISYHLLEATAVHLHFTKGPLEALQANGGAAAAAQQNGYGAQQQMTNGGDSGLAGITPVARRVYQCLKTSPQTNEGLHAQDIATRTGMEMTEVLKAGDELMGLGKVYTTVDDHTWALLDL